MRYFMRQIPEIMRVAFLFMALSFLAPIAFAEVKISGIDGKAYDNVRIMLSLEKEKCDAPEWKIRGLYAKADQEIDEGLRALGHYHGVVKKSLAFGKACWQADFTINPGPRAYVNDVNITINGAAQVDPAFQSLREIGRAHV